MVFYLVFSSVYWKQLITILHNLLPLMAYKANEGEHKEEQDRSNNRKGNSGFLTKNF